MPDEKLFGLAMSVTFQGFFAQVERMFTKTARACLWLAQGDPSSSLAEVN
jgi:hypothetical protein